MVKNTKKLVKKPLFYVTFLLFLFSFCSGCSYSCKFSPDYEKIGDSAAENIENLAETNLKSGKIVCNY
jgi:hypothetical protein